MASDREKVNVREQAEETGGTAGSAAPPKLGEVLVAAGVVSQEQVEAALSIQDEDLEVGGKKRRLGQILVAQGFITEEQVARALSGQLRLGYVDLRTLEIAYEDSRLVSQALAERHNVIPIGISVDDQLLLAMVDPTDVVARDDIRAASGKRVKALVACETHIKWAINKLYRFMGDMPETPQQPGKRPTRSTAAPRSVGSGPFARPLASTLAAGVPTPAPGGQPAVAVAPESTSSPAGEGTTSDPSLASLATFLVTRTGAPSDDLPINFEALIEASPEFVASGHVAETADDARSGPVLVRPDAAETTESVELVGVILKNAVAGRAWQIEIEPRAHDVEVHFRVDGEHQHVMSVAKDLHLALVRRMKRMAGLDPEDVQPQQGNMQLPSADVVIEGELLTTPTRHGETIVIRIPEVFKEPLSLEKLGLSDQDVNVVGQALSDGRGLVLVAGPPGSGTTTTIAAMALAARVGGRKLVAVGPLPELSGVTQIPVDKDNATGLANAVEAALRLAPDVLLVDRVESTEVGELVLEAAAAGALVVIGIDAATAPGAVTRLRTLGVDSLLLGAALGLVVCQRLFRRICTHCPAPAAETPARFLEQLEISPPEATHLRKGAGCATCRQTGHRGRVGAFQLLTMTPAAREAILASVPEAALAETSREAGMRTLLQVGGDLAVGGITTTDEVVHGLRSLLRESRPSTCPLCGSATPA